MKLLASGAASLAASRVLADATASSAPAPVRKPNIIFILTDDLGYGDLACYGNKHILTPNLDRMASQGTRFTQVYCGTSVCAPSRCSLLTGMHTGHTPIRANRDRPGGEGQVPMPGDTVTIARILKDAGYSTACIGKWGLGYPGSASEPNKMGFDYFFGFNCQMLAHNQYPAYLWRNREKVQLDGKTYAHDQFTVDAMAWIQQNAEHPFFLYLAYTLPHDDYRVPDLGPYANARWNLAGDAGRVAKTYAAMVSRVDRDVGALLELLREIGQDDNTIIFFCSDNGSALDPENGAGRFLNTSGSLRGHKRGMYEGSLRTPMIVRWPGRVPAGQTRDEPWALWDVLPTLAELGDAKIPAAVTPDGVSVAPLLTGGRAPQHAFFYWELHEGRFNQACRKDDWKAVRNGPQAAIELYDLKADPREEHDVAAMHPDIVRTMDALLREERTDTREWHVAWPAPTTQPRP